MKAAKIKSLKARRMWANYYKHDIELFPTRQKSAFFVVEDVEHKFVPVAVIPLDDKERVLLDALYAWEQCDGDGEDSMRAALAAIGVLPKQRKGGAK